MKIAVFTTYFAPEVNGLTRYIEGLYGALLRQHPEISIDVYTFDTQKTGVFEERIEGFNVYRAECATLLGGTYALPTPQGCRRLWRAFKSTDYALVNTHTRFFLSTLLGLIFAGRRRVGTMHTEHGSGFVAHENSFIRLAAYGYDLTLGAYSLRRANGILAVSESVAQFIERFSGRKAVVISNGIDVSFWRADSEKRSRESARARYRIGPGEAGIVFAGRLIAAKGCQDLLLALRDVRSFRWRLCIAGDGPYRMALERIAEQSGIAQSVSFLGALPKEEVRELFRAADIFVNPSLSAEGLPTTLLEASAVGCTCLSSDAGGSKDVLPEACLYPAGDKRALQGALEHYATIPKTDVSQYDWDLIAKKFFRILEDVQH